ncbi:GAF domain-containing protein [Aquabacter sp. L1I39]|uniref:ATP-binding protein n=1 Tax=Aquabacter sp. L1I39 TaxID=2820278 RepID=UPI001ADCE24F|nr:ATP-binding protein [Aquabacter sp. L1I39]QTL02167.1 GAF domain-containing protein [Aquabacter sp. L1I39]
MREASRPDLLEACAQEPIRIPGGVQPHGALLVLRPDDLAVVQASANAADILGFPVAAERTPRIADLPLGGGTLLDDIARWSAGQDGFYLKAQAIADRMFEVSAHRTPQGLLVEFEPACDLGDPSETFYPVLRDFLEESEALPDTLRLAEAVAARVRRLTGFNRVMIYRFDEDWNGTVLAEDGDGALPSYLDLRFPASDIPAQARDLYRLNRLRIIPTCDYAPVPLVPELSPLDGAPLDLSFAALRSVSPVHLEYMRNMGTAASMSISLMVSGKLWGLISCHHAQARRVGAQVRAACDFLGRMVAQQIDARERGAEVTERLRLHQVQTELVAHLARAPAFQAGLVERAVQWLDIVNAQGAAVLTEGTVLTAGITPSAEQVAELAEWLRTQKIEQAFATDCLSRHWPKGLDMADVASGILAVPISRLHASFIIWFRPEVIRTVTWGGDPATAKQQDAAGRLHPRRSFESWKEQVRHRSTPWREAELLSAADFRVAVVNFVLQRAEERAQLSEELQRSNKELEAFSYSISHDLRAPFRHIAGYAQLLAEEEPGLKPLSHHYLEGISRAALSAGQLVDDLLHFSQLGRASLKTSRIDMTKVMEEVRHSLDATETGRVIEWQVGALPPCWGDPSLVRQALFNLVENAVKYTRGCDPTRIRVEGREEGDLVVYTVTDNGIGFDMAYGGKLFQVFQRLHRPEDFEGTGIGLALTKRIIDRHGGSVQAKGAVGQGATFSFSLPRHAKGKGRGDT